MSITVECPHCGQHHKLEDDTAGTLRRCDCGQSYRVPGDKPAPPIPSPRDAANRLSPKLKIMLGALLGVIILGVALHLVQVIRWQATIRNPAAPILLPRRETPISELVDGIESESRDDRDRAKQALVERGEEAIKPLITVLEHENHLIRTDAVWVLTQIGEAAAPDLLEALDDEHPQVVGSAAKVLAEMGEQRAIPQLIVKLQEYSADTKTTRQPQPSPELSQEEREEWRLQRNAVARHRGHALSAIARALGELQAVEAIQPLLDAIAINSADLNDRIGEALVKIGRPAIAPLNEALWQLGTEGKAVAALALAKLDPAGTSEELARMATSQDREVQFAAAVALAELKDLRALPVLIAVVEDRWQVSSANCVPEAIRLLGELGDPQAVPALISILDHKRQGPRRLAIEALGKLGHRDAVEPLIAQLSDEDGILVGRAATALGHIGDRRALKPLEMAMEGGGYDVCLRASSALVAIGGTSVLPILLDQLEEGHTGAGNGTCKTLQEMGADAAPALVAAIDDERENVRKLAWNTLSRMGDPALDALIAGVDTAEGESREQILTLLRRHEYQHPRAREAIERAEAADDG